MKTIKMKTTQVHINASGCNQVFGPPGKEFTLDDETADALLDSGAAKLIKGEKKVVEVAVEAVSE
jgi:hypothetical protein